MSIRGEKKEPGRSKIKCTDLLEETNSKRLCQNDDQNVTLLDLIVGAFGTGKVAVYRARPVVTVDAQLLLNPVIINLENKTCQIPDAMTSAAWKYKMELDYNTAQENTTLFPSMRYGLTQTVFLVSENVRIAERTSLDPEKLFPANFNMLLTGVHTGVTAFEDSYEHSHIAESLQPCLGWD
ncbi:hypothetical protein P7K49_014821 [Saguinus oedipus]|uniref:Uncharacterized protein n=1 Tax=Saguinus oedipus TaxID=9490 RepID=A0ABQ9VA72_SAGOE|nr:hypothetical protein P7K49_014821 [Saguinus oedipus]